MNYFFDNRIFVKDTEKKGRGIFAKENIPANTIVEKAPVVVMTTTERTLLDQTKLHDYIFEWEGSGGTCCMALGYIPVYNHSYLANCEYFMDYEEDTIAIKTVRKITAGEEITINYNGDWDDSKAVWFDTAL